MLGIRYRLQNFTRYASLYREYRSKIGENPFREQHIDERKSKLKNESITFEHADHIYKELLQPQLRWVVAYYQQKTGIDPLAEYKYIQESMDKKYFWSRVVGSVSQLCWPFFVLAFASTIFHMSLKQVLILSLPCTFFIVPFIVWQYSVWKEPINAWVYTKWESQQFFADVCFVSGLRGIRHTLGAIDADISRLPLHVRVEFDRDLLGEAMSVKCYESPATMNSSELLSRKARFKECFETAKRLGIIEEDIKPSYYYDRAEGLCGKKI